MWNYPFLSIETPSTKISIKFLLQQGGKNHKREDPK